MKTAALVHKVVRLVETQGVIGDGVQLASDYARAVADVNARMEAVEAAVSARQISEAIRLLDQEPRLIDEVNALDFVQLPDWTVLCQNNGWTSPVQIDRRLLERVLLVCEGKEAMEPVLSMYRKSRLTNNDQLAWQSLRRLVELDPAGDWRRELLSVEPAIQRQMLESFKNARKTGDEDLAEQIAVEIVATKWADAASFRGLDEVRAFVASKEALRRGVKASEDIGLIRDALSGVWRKSLVESVLKDLDGLVRAGWRPGVEDETSMSAARQRCQDEDAAAAFERAWTSAMDELSVALESDDLDRIDKALGNVAFKTREPDEGVLTRASEVIARVQAMRRRKKRMIVAGILLVVTAAVVTAVIGTNRHMLETRTSAEYGRLAALIKKPHTAGRVLDELKRLEREDPAVFADSRFRLVEQEAKSLLALERSKKAARDHALDELQKLKADGWTVSDQVVKAAFDGAAELIETTDEMERLKYQGLLAEWKAHCEAQAEAKKAEAKKARDEIIAKVDRLAGELAVAYPTAQHEEAVRQIRTECEAWRENSMDAELAPKLRESEDRLRRAAERQVGLKNAVETLAAATDAAEVASVRAKIRSEFSGYEVVAGIGDLPYTAGDIRALLRGELSGQKLLAKDLKSGLPEADFREFLMSRVIEPLSRDSYSGVYGFKVPLRETYIAVSRGRPTISSAGSLFIAAKAVDNGLILNSRKGALVDELRGNTRPTIVLMPSSEEVLDLLDAASKPGFSQSDFERLLLGLIDRHIMAAHGPAFLKDEVEEGSQWCELKIDRYPAILRLRMVAAYMSWLSALNLMPPDESLRSWMKQTTILAQKPVHVGDVPEELIWACMFEDRVRRYNVDCANHLRQMPADWVERYQKIRAAYRSVEGIGAWQIVSAGKLAYIPTNPAWLKDRHACFPQVLSKIRRDHPLYVLREMEGDLCLCRALVPGSGNGWAIAPGMSNELRAGEPLFQVQTPARQPLDAGKELKRLLENASSSLRKRLEGKNSLWRIEVK